MDVNEKSGFIYVLTNESFHRDNWIKIGYAENVEKRVKELSGTAVPLPFEVYCTYEIPRIKGTKDPDKLVHDLIQTLNPDLRITDNREFFELYPWDAFNMLSAIAKLHNRMDKLVRNDSNKSGQIDSNDSEYTVENLFPVDKEIYSLYQKLKRLIGNVDSQIEEKALKNYVSYKLGKGTFIDLWPQAHCIEVCLNAKLGTIKDNSGIVYDISNRRWSSEQYAFKYYSDTDESVVKALLEQVYNLKKK